jgi:uncharacterized membrane protein
MEDFNENKIRYLEMIQTTITRMATNSFALKGWVVTLVAGILALSSNDSDKKFILIAFIPIIIFWFLDSYYLQLERKYRALFDYIRKNNVEINFDMNLKNFSNSFADDTTLNFFSCFFSKTEWLFYIPTAIIVGIVLKITNAF